MIELWVQRQQQASADITLLCSLEDRGFLSQAHRRAGGGTAIAAETVGWRSWVSG
ncbi:hypothetical protein LC653_43095 [Nostoc sp. CHAB 5784]|uniref:hypothetical protein n=1 Tax=Nostoc mirabile TaxID=2907820 RepID=UPI001E44C0D8|nr:hypothetical protein [Nostoc mirabile]MCC5670394.1 hypothetical protein [Nostoc mirabile CHAB5784]